MTTNLRMKIYSLALSLLVGSLLLAHGDQTSNATAGHNGLHRLERLVQLKKIDKNYLLKFKELSVFQLTDAVTGFRVVISQYPGADGRANQLEILLNEKAIPIKDVVIAGSEAVGAPIWSAKDGVTLTEDACHYLLDATETKPELEVFEANFAGATLSQLSDGNAQVDIRSSATTQVYRVILNPAGNVISGQIIDL